MEAGTRVRHRYEIGCDKCGLVDTAMTLAQATTTATKHADGHSRVTIWDAMARRGYAVCVRVYAPDLILPNKTGGHNGY